MRKKANSHQAFRKFRKWQCSPPLGEVTNIKTIMYKNIKLQHTTEFLEQTTDSPIG
jgi:hypothetical protein